MLSTLTNLQVCFYGPLVFDFCKDFVVVYAPQCDEHFASVQGDNDDNGLPGRTRDGRSNLPSDNSETDPIYQYEIRGIVGTTDPTKTSWLNPNKIVMVERSRCREDNGPDIKDCHWQLKLPRPDRVIGLISDSSSILEYDLPNPGNGFPEPRATAIRFLYDRFDPSNDVAVIETEGPQKGDVIFTGHFDPPLSECRITIRYAGSVNPGDHLDAEDCFSAMRALFPPLGAWRVRFKTPIARWANDCKAPMVVLVTSDEYKLRKDGKEGELARLNT